MAHVLNKKQVQILTCFQTPCHSYLRQAPHESSEISHIAYQDISEPGTSGERNLAVDSKCSHIGENKTWWVLRREPGGCSTLLEGLSQSSSTGAIASGVLRRHLMLTLRKESVTPFADYQVATQEFIE